MGEILKNKKIIIIISIILILFFIKYFFDKTNKLDTENIEENALVSMEDEEKNNDEAEIIVIHIIGAVKTPGVVRAPEGSRIEDIIKLAGGLTEDADITNVNLAYVLEDGVKIRIPSVNDEGDIEEKNISEENGEGIIISNDKSENSVNIININTATQTELETLTGIGPSIALKIIEYREKNGNFKSIDDVKNVSGIGESKFESIKEWIKV